MERSQCLFRGENLFAICGYRARTICCLSLSPQPYLLATTVWNRYEVGRNSFDPFNYYYSYEFRFRYKVFIFCQFINLMLKV
jgi:hypothetical protein